MRKLSKGLFITFEGIEGCGKSTQAKMLANTLKEQNYQVMSTREPGGPAISEKIRNLLLDKTHSEMDPRTEVLLYAASRAQHTAQWIIPALQEGKVVICDRYYDSTLAYQGYARQIDTDMIDTLTRYAAFNLEPDLTFMPDLPIECGQERILGRELDRMELQGLEFHKKVRQGFLDVAKRFEHRYHILNGKLPIDDLFAQIHKIVQNTLRGLL